jgi:ubiquinone/menaquinone biosynthesis C-methylase UbiE
MCPYGYIPTEEPRFGEVGEEYERFRTGYGRAAYEHLLHEGALRPGADVVDVGCGTGVSTEPLLAHGATVIGIDPDPEMLARAHRRLGGRARLLEGRAEALPVPDRSVDLVVAGQAAHWFREPDASRELARVLRPGGTVAYLWKYPAPDTPWVYLVDELLVELGGEPVRSIYGVGTVPELIAEPWHRYRRAVFEHPVPYTVESYVGYVASRFRIRRMVGERHGEFFERLRARLESEVVHGAFVERNLTYVVSARRRA